MPSVSQQQQKFFGWAKRNPEQAAAEGLKMSPEKVNEFASTPRKGLPVRVKPAKYRGINE